MSIFSKIRESLVKDRPVVEEEKELVIRDGKFVEQEQNSLWTKDTDQEIAASLTEKLLIPHMTKSGDPEQRLADLGFELGILTTQFEASKDPADKKRGLKEMSTCMSPFVGNSFNEAKSAKWATLFSSALAEHAASLTPAELKNARDFHDAIVPGKENRHLRSAANSFIEQTRSIHQEKGLEKVVVLDKGQDQLMESQREKFQNLNQRGMERWY